MNVPEKKGYQNSNYLTVDVEDYFQVSAFEDSISNRQWDDMEKRVEANTDRLLTLLKNHSVFGTFFVVGWIAEKFPHLVLKIRKQGHEIGCHSFWHRKVYDLTPEEFREDTLRAKQVLENITGTDVQGYRAPSYSITKKSMWALDVLEDLGFVYDSSIFPIYHDTYGIPDAPRFEYHISGKRLKEYPISTVRLGKNNFPASGGGYFRLFPYWFTRLLLRTINQKEQKPFMFYIHPWELDPEQPRVANVKIFSKFRHYNNLDKTANRLERLLGDFRFGPVGAK